jgi:hypothetical protein
MIKRLLGITFVAASIVGVVGASPASGRPGGTVTVTCTGGQGVVSDTRSLFGQTTANGVYNLVNPFGEVCTVNP